MRYSITPLGGAKQSVSQSVGAIVRYLIGKEGPPASTEARSLPSGADSGRGPARYYADGGDEPGRWLGEGADRLGLHGVVEGDDLARVLAGRDPRTGERLITAQGSAGRRPRLGVGSETRWDQRGDPIYDARDAAAALGIDPEQLDELLQTGTRLAASRLFEFFAHGAGRETGTVEASSGTRQEASAEPYLAPVIDLDGAFWLSDSELTRYEDAVHVGVDPDQVLRAGAPDDLLPFAEAARLVGVTPRYLRTVAARYERDRATIEQLLAEGSQPRKAYLVARRGPRKRWLVARKDLAEFVRRREPPAVRVGYDVTLTTEKSLSVLAMLVEPRLGKEVLDTVQAANDQALGWLEEHAAAARSRGKRVKVKGWMVASFRHLTSRALDPFAHWHNVVPNSVEDREGVHRALDARGLYANGTAASAIATVDMRWRITHRLGVRWRPGRKSGWEIEGLGDALLGEFSTRRNDVDDAVRELEEVIGRGARPDEVEQLVLKTRPPKQSADVDDLRADWWRRATAHGLSHENLVACLGHAPPAGPPDEDWIYDELAKPDGICRNVSVFDLGDVLSALCDMPIPQPEGRPSQPLIVPAARLLQLAAGFLESHHVVEVIGGDNAAYTTTEILAVQQRIVDRYSTGRRMGVAGRVPLASVDGVLTTYPQLTAEQRLLVRRICTSGQRVQCAIGYPGAGKTTTMAAARAVWEKAGWRVVGSAVTGEAARLLAEATGMQTETLAWLLAHEDPLSAPLDARTVLVVDEASTISDRDLDRIGWLCAQTGATLRLVGDPGQHGAVEAGGMFRVLCERFAKDTPALTQTHRVQDPNDRAAADALRQGRIDLALDHLEIAGHLHLVEDEADFYRQVLSHWWQAWTAGHRHPMVDGRNAVRQRLNHLAHRLLQARGEVGHQEITAEGDRGFAVGDQVITRSPARHLHPPGRPGAYVRNRSVGVVTKLRRGDRAIDDVITVDFEGIGTVDLPRAYIDTHEVNPGKLDVGLDHAYAVTSYAVQGSTKAISTSRIDQRSTRAEMLVDITRGERANHVYLTRSTNALDDEQLPRVPPRPIDQEVISKLRRSAGETTAWEILNPADRGDEIAATTATALGL